MNLIWSNSTIQDPVSSSGIWSVHQRFNLIMGFLSNLPFWSPGFLSNQPRSNQPRSNPVIWDPIPSAEIKLGDTSFNWSITRSPKYGLILDAFWGLLFHFHRSSIWKAISLSRIRSDQLGSNLFNCDLIWSFSIPSKHPGSDMINSFQSDHLASCPISPDPIQSSGIKLRIQVWTRA